MAATKAKTRQAIHDMEDAFLRCRAMRFHAFEEFHPARMRRPEFGFRVSNVCITCGVERHDIFNWRGDRLQREYRYPEGYRIAGTENLPTSLFWAEVGVRRKSEMRKRPSRRKVAEGVTKKQRRLTAVS
jgi:hypothetical protein